jgi:ribosome-associated protein
MKPEELKIRHFGSELKYSASRSSGPGGQNVNKVNTKVELRLSVISTLNLSENEKEIVFRKLKKRINNDGELVIVAQDGRTQAENKLIVTERFFELLAKALTVRPSRKATRPTLSSKIKRLEKKRSRSNVKKLRSSGISPDET